MDAFFPTLLSKTLIILTSQLVVTFLGGYAVVQYFKGLYAKGHKSVTATHTREGKVDIHVDPRFVKPYIWPLLIVNIITFLALLFIGSQNLTIGIPLFTLWSFLTGLEIGIVLIRVDENLLMKVLSITVLTTFMAALIGMYSGIDFSGLGKILFVGLIVLIGANIVRLFVRMRRMTHRLIAGVGVGIFVGYLLYDFNRLEKLADVANNWPVAFNFAIEIYLDIINLFLYLLELLSD